jgi:hypothetical protein
MHHGLIDDTSLLLIVSFVWSWWRQETETPKHIVRTDEQHARCLFRSFLNRSWCHIFCMSYHHPLFIKMMTYTYKITSLLYARIVVYCNYRNAATPYAYCFNRTLSFLVAVFVTFPVTFRLLIFLWYFVLDSLWRYAALTVCRVVAIWAYDCLPLSRRDN